MTLNTLIRIMPMIIYRYAATILIMMKYTSILHMT